MKAFKTLFTVALASLSTAAMAQATYTDKDGNEYTFKKHTFLDLLSPNVQLGIGYQFTPVFGMRLQANGWQSKGAGMAIRQLRMVLLIPPITSLSM